MMRRLPVLKSALQALTATDQWLDCGGSGEPQSDYLKDTSFPSRARVTTISYDLKVADGQKAPGVRLLCGRFLEDIPNEEIGNAKLITDFLGPFAYSPEPDVILQKYLDLLDTGGKIFLDGQEYRNGDKYTKKPRGFSLESTVRKIGHKDRTLIDWLQSIPGLKVTIHDIFKQDQPFEGRLHRIFIELEKVGRVKIPALKLVKENSDVPPVRLLVEIEEEGNIAS